MTGKEFKNQENNQRKKNDDGEASALALEIFSGYIRSNQTLPIPPADNTPVRGGEGTICKRDAVIRNMFQMWSFYADTPAHLFSF